MEKILYPSSQTPLEAGKENPDRTKSWNQFISGVNRTEDEIKDWTIETLKKAMDEFGLVSAVVRGDVEGKWKSLQVPSIGRTINPKHGEIRLILGGMFSGKCCAKGTPILMYDGLVKPVESISVGDLLMGDDNSPRTVLSTSSGEGELYRVSPRSTKRKGENRFPLTPSNGQFSVENNAIFDENENEENGINSMESLEKDHCRDWWDPYVVNADHVLSLRCASDCQTWRLRLLEAPARVHLEWLDRLTWRDVDFMLEAFGRSVENATQAALAFLEHIHPTRPGHRLDVPLRRFLACPPHVRQCYRGYAVAVQFSESCDLLPSVVREIGRALGHGLAVHNRVVERCRVSSSVLRRQLLAGLLDVCGVWSDPHHDLSLELPATEGLVELTLFVARSLGMRGRKGPRVGHVQLGSGPRLQQIPWAPISKIGRRHEEDPWELEYALEIRRVGHGRYYGFTLDGNGRYLHGDFSVTHNTRELKRRVDVKRIACERIGGRCLLIRYRQDQRYHSNALATHNGILDGEAVAADTLAEMEPLALCADFIFIDEGQFFPDLREHCIRWACQGKEVTVAALDAYANQDLWPEVARLLPWAVSLQKLNAVCTTCGSDAPLTVSVDGSRKAETKIGGKEMYTASCIHCACQSKPLLEQISTSASQS